MNASVDAIGVQSERIAANNTNGGAYFGLIATNRALLSFGFRLGFRLWFRLWFRWWFRFRW